MTEKDRFDFNLILEKLSGQEYPASVAFKELYDRFAPNIYFSAKKFLKSEALAEDVVQEVFTIIWEKRTQLSFIQNFESYLYGMTSKKAYDVIRRRVNAEAIKRKHLDLMAVSEDPSKEKYAQQLDALIEKLPYPRKDIFQHAKIDGIQGKAIAEKFNLSENAVHLHISKALRMINEAKHDVTALLIISIALIKRLAEF